MSRRIDRARLSCVGVTVHQVSLRRATKRRRTSRTIWDEAAAHPVAPAARPLHPVLQAQRVLGNRTVRQFLASRPSMNGSLAFERQLDRIARKSPPVPGPHRNPRPPGTPRLASRTSPPRRPGSFPIPPIGRRRVRPRSTSATPSMSSTWPPKRASIAVKKNIDGGK